MFLCYCLPPSLSNSAESDVNSKKQCAVNSIKVDHKESKDLVLSFQAKEKFDHLLVEYSDVFQAIYRQVYSLYERCSMA